jgi:hypothetical protein
MLAIDGLGFLAANPEALGRFLALTGIGPADLRRAAADRGFLAGVLDYFLGDEPLLVSFAEYAGIPATDIGLARRALDGKPAP